MTRIRSMPEITEEGTRALVQALGYPDAVRFLTALRPGRGDYTKERRKLLKGVTLDRIIAESDRMVAAQAKPRGKRRRSA